MKQRSSLDQRRKPHTKRKTESNDVGIYSTIHINKQEKIPINKTVKQIMLYSRQNFIRHFSFYQTFPLKDSMDIDSILAAHSNYSQTLPSYFEDSNEIKSIQNDISGLYKTCKSDPSTFVKQLLSQKNLPIFAYIIIPAIFGYYLDPYQEDVGFNLIYKILQSDPFDYDASKPFLLSYIFSSTLFLDFFWEDLFIKISKTSQTPSLFYLQELLFETLKSSLNCFSANQVKVLSSLIEKSYDLFHDLFFDELLLQTFDILNYSNRLPIELLKTLFDYIKSSKECQTRINDIFTQMPGAGCVLPSFLPKDGNDKVKEIVVCLSYHELQLLSDLIKIYNDTTDQPREFTVPNDVNPNTPFYLRVPFTSKRSKLPKPGPKPFSINDSCLTFSQMEIESENYGIAPYMIFNRCYQSDFDSFDLLRLKNEYNKKEGANDNSLDEGLMMEFINVQGTTTRTNFNKFLENKQKLKDLNDTKNRVRFHLNRHEMTFYSKIPQEKLENIPLVIAVNAYQNEFALFQPCRYAFTRYILNLAMNDSKYKTFILENQNNLMELKHWIWVLDSLPISTRLFILEYLLISISALVQNNSRWINPTFLSLLNQNEMWPIYEALIVFYKYKKENMNKYPEIEWKLEYTMKFFEFISHNMINTEIDDTLSEFESYDIRAILSVLNLKEFKEARPKSS